MDIAKQIFGIIQREPEYFAWVFALVNVLWGFFVYFHQKRHSKEIEALKQTLNLDLERRRKVFEMKATQYETYFNNIDAFQRKHQNDYQEIFVPIFNEYIRRSLEANKGSNTSVSTSATTWFSQEIQKITLDGFQERQALELQTNSLKLTASDEVAVLLDELKQLYNQIFRLSGEHMNRLVEITVNKDQNAFDQMRSELAELGGRIKTKSQNLREEMRKDLQKI